MTQSIERSSLGNLVKIGQGGQGLIYRAPNVKTTFSRSMVFKEYKPAVLAALDIDALTAMPEFLEENLTYREGATLISLAAWPCRIVEDNGQIKGFVMPAIPDHFFVELSTATGPTRVAAEFQHLLNDAHILHMRFGDQVISDRQRYELLRHVASALNFLHGHGVCVGDMSPKNLLFSLSGTPEVYFIDCDAMRVHGVSLTEQLETPGWEAPHGEEKATIFSDRYKLGLLALRLILGSQDAKDPTRLPTDIPATLRQIITDTLTLPPDQRPTLTAWDIALDKAILATPATPPLPAPWPPQLSTPTPTPTQPATPTPQGGGIGASSSSWVIHPGVIALAGSLLLVALLIGSRVGLGTSESLSSTTTSSSTTAAYPTTSDHGYSSTVNSSPTPLHGDPETAPPMELQPYVTDIDGALTAEQEADVNQAIEHLMRTSDARLWVVYTRETGSSIRATEDDAGAFSFVSSTLWVADNFANYRSIATKHSAKGPWIPAQPGAPWNDDFILAIRTGNDRVQYTLMGPTTKGAKWSLLCDVDDTGSNAFCANGVEPAVSSGDWAGAAIAAAQGLEAILHR